jgi:adenylate cyclase
MVGASSTSSFVRQLNRMLGPGTLVNLLLSRYHRPVAEDRIFMFLDLNDSTAIAELRGKVEALRVDGRRR